MTADVVPLFASEPVFEIVGGASDQGITWAWARGDLDLERLSAARAELHELLSGPHRPEWLLVYFGAECFVDLQGLRMLADIAERLAYRGGRLVVVAPPTCVRVMVELTGIGATIPFAVSARHACSVVRRHRAATPAGEDR